MDVHTALDGLKKDLFDFYDETKFLTQTVNDFANKFQNQSYSGKPSQSKRRVGNFIAAGGGIVCVAGVGLSFITLGGAVGIILAGKKVLCFKFISTNNNKEIKYKKQ